jgi:hypothetical protein
MILSSDVTSPINSTISGENIKPKPKNGDHRIFYDELDALLRF